MAAAQLSALGTRSQSCNLYILILKKRRRRNLCILNNYAMREKKKKNTLMMKYSSWGPSPIPGAVFVHLSRPVLLSDYSFLLPNIHRWSHLIDLNCTFSHNRWKLINHIKWCEWPRSYPKATWAKERWKAEFTWRNCRSVSRLNGSVHLKIGKQIY